MRNLYYLLLWIAGIAIHLHLAYSRDRSWADQESHVHLLRLRVGRFVHFDAGLVIAIGGQRLLQAIPSGLKFFVRY